MTRVERFGVNVLRGPKSVGWGTWVRKSGFPNPKHDWRWSSRRDGVEESTQWMSWRVRKVLNACDSRSEVMWGKTNFSKTRVVSAAGHCTDICLKHPRTTGLLVLVSGDAHGLGWRNSSLKDPNIRFVQWSRILYQSFRMSFMLALRWVILRQENLSAMTPGLREYSMWKSKYNRRSARVGGNWRELALSSLPDGWPTDKVSRLWKAILFRYFDMTLKSSAEKP